MRPYSHHLLVIFFCFLPHLLLSQSDYANRLKAMRAEEVKIEKFIQQNIRKTPQSAIAEFQKSLLVKNHDHPKGLSQTEIKQLTDAFKKNYWRNQYFLRFPAARDIYDSPYTRFCKNGGFERGDLDGYTLEYVHFAVPGGGYTIGECSIDPSDYGFLPDVEGANTDNFLVVEPGTDPLVPLNMVHSGDYAVRINSDRPLTNPITSSCYPKNGINKLSKRIILPDDRDSISFYYAIVLENPDGHDNGQPTFMARVLNSEGIEQDRVCNSAGSGDPFLITQDDTSGNGCDLDPIKYQMWYCESLNFDGNEGDTIYLEFYATDCGQGLHFGYAYVDDICARCIKDTCNDKGGVYLSPGEPCFDGEGFYQVCGTYDLPVLDCQPGSYESLELIVIQDGVETALSLSSAQISVNESAQSFCINLAASDFPSMSDGPYDFKVVITFDVDGAPHAENDYHTIPGPGNDVTFDCPIDFCCKGTNFVINGNFSNGNSGFSSDYQYESDHSAGSVTPGEYTIGNSSDALAVSSNWDLGCNDADEHLLVNGQNNLTDNSSIWSQTVWVNDASTYSFCVRLKNLPQCEFDVLPSVAVNFSLPDFNIPFTTIDLPTTGDCEWEVLAQLIEVPDGVNSLTITILLDESSLGDGNDLAVDNIILTELEEVAPSNLLFSTTPFNLTKTAYNVEADPSVALPASCSYEWSVAEVDANFDDVPGTVVDNPVEWQTDPNPNTFIGYNGSSTLSGTNHGVFEQGRRYRITYTRYCDCSLPNSFTVFLIPGKSSRQPEIKREDEIERESSSRFETGGTLNDSKSNEKLDEGFLVYPSPASEVLRMEYFDVQPKEILIFDASGKVIKRMTHLEPGSSEISVQSWPDGVYFVQFKSEEKLLKTLRFLVESD